VIISIVLCGADSLDGIVSQAQPRCNVVIMKDGECTEVSCGHHVSMVYSSKTKEIYKGHNFQYGNQFRAK
jgi:hypothetical protein